MRIGLYGLPTAGKSYIMEAIEKKKGGSDSRFNELDVIYGSKMLSQIAPNFHSCTEDEKSEIREKFASIIAQRKNVIVDGHFAFGNNVVFTPADGNAYDVFLYLYVDSNTLRQRMMLSPRNQRYLQYVLDAWQNQEITELRNWCHEHEKDFYVIDNPEEGCFHDISLILNFIADILGGFSCINYAKKIAREAVQKREGTLHITSFDGDRPMIHEESEMLMGYRPNVYNGDFYTGFQSWRHNLERDEYVRLHAPNAEALLSEVTLNKHILQCRNQSTLILTSGWLELWEIIGKNTMLDVFGGREMCADTKFFVSRFLKKAGLDVTAYGDSLNDYFMLIESDYGFLVKRSNGSFSSSLKNYNLEGLAYA